VIPKQIEVYEIPKIVFDEFKYDEEKIIEKDGVEYHIARLRLKRKPTKISEEFLVGYAITNYCEFSNRKFIDNKTYFDTGYIFVFKGWLKEINSENIFQKKVISVYLGPDFTSNQPQKKDTIFLHIIDHMILASSSGLCLVKILLRATHLFHSRNCKKKL